MRFSFTGIVFLALVSLVSCTRHDRDDAAARQAGRDAYRAAQSAKRDAREAERDIRNAGKEFRDGWNEARRQDAARHGK